MRVEILDQFLFSGRLVTGEDNCEEAEHPCDKTKKQAQKNDYRLFKGELTPVYAAAPMSLTKQGEDCSPSRLLFKRVSRIGEQNLTFAEAVAFTWTYSWIIRNLKNPLLR